MRKTLTAALLTASFAVWSCRQQYPEIEMVDIEAGTIVMGSSDCDADSDERGLHEVGIAAFRIGRYEVTQRQWRAVTGSNPSFFKGDDLPVECVSWQQAEIFIDKLNRKTGHRYRLPTEAEWEYAARGGRLGSTYRYAGSDEAGSVAWYAANSDSCTHACGSKQPNALGIYDMSGNVNEWCSDTYDPLAYTRHSAAAETAPNDTFSDERVFRGGGWYSQPRHVRIANRNHAASDTRDPSLGLRLAEDID